MAVELIKVPDTMFNSVVKVREIVTATLYNKATMEKINRQISDGDILIETKDGQKKLISRMELIKNYTNLNGSKITMAGWHYNKKYTLMRNSKEPMAMLKIPRGSHHLITVNGSELPKGTAVVCQIKDGQIIKANPAVYMPKEFVRMFLVAEKADYLSAKKEIHNIKRTVQLTKEREEKKNLKVWNEKERVKKVDRELEQAKLVATMRIVNARNQICGFVISNGKQMKMLNLAQTKELCRQKKIKNLVIVINENNNKEFLRGNGIKIDNLPVKQI